MTVNDDLGYADINRIFNERDRRAAINGTSARKIEPAARRREISSAEREAGRYERTPKRDEFTPSRKKPKLVSNKGEHLKTKKGKRLEQAETKNKPASNTSKIKPIKLTTRQKIALALALAGGGGAAFAYHGTAPAENIANKLPPPDEPGIMGEVPEDYIQNITKTSTEEIISNIIQYGGSNISDNTIEDDVEFVIEEPGIEGESGVEEEDGVQEEPVEYCSMTDVTDRCIDAIKGWEGFYTTAYLCPGGRWTIGTGHTAGVYEGQTITQEEGSEFLRSDLQHSMSVVRKYCEGIGLDLTQAQFDSLTSFTFNCGEGNFRGSGIPEALLEGDIDEAARIMQMYRKSGGEIMPGLVTRRAEEASWLYE